MLKILCNGIPLALAAFAGLVCSRAALAQQELSLDVGSPVATGDSRAKSAVFAIRSRGCADLASLRISGVAEGLVDTKRETVPLANIAALPSPGVFFVPRQWPGEGVWVVHVVARCGDATAGALVPIGGRTFVRESCRFFPRAATAEEIEASLRAHSQAISRQEQPER